MKALVKIEKGRRLYLYIFTIIILFFVISYSTNVFAAIKPTHPRLILTDSKLIELRAKACYDASGNVISGCTSQTSWIRLKTWVDKNLNKPNNKDLLYSGIRGFALVYQITRNTVYSDKVISLLEYWYSSYDITTGPPNAYQYGARGVGKNVAVGYDWVYDRLTSDQRNRFSSRMDQWIQYIFAEPYCQNCVDHDYYYGYLVGIGSMAYAIYGDNVNAQGYINTIKGRINNAVVPFLDGGAYTQPLSTGYSIKKGTGLGPGGIWMGGWQYGDETFKALFDLFQLIRSAEGIDYLSSLNFTRELPIGFIHSTMPDLQYVYRNGKMRRDSTNQIVPYYRIWMAMLANEYQGTQLSRWAQYWLNNNNMPGWMFTGNEWLLLTAADEFLWYDSTLSQENYNTLDPVYYSPGSQILIGRSGWSANDTWFTFKSGGRWSTTNDNSQNHFEIYKYSLLAGDSSGFPPYSGVGSVEEAASFHNIIINNLPPDEATDSWSPPYAPAYYQREATIDRREDTTNYAYIVGDATDVYVNQYGSGVTFNEREFLYIKDIDHFVVFDRYNTDGTPSQIWWLLHSYNQPTILSSDTARIDNGSGRLFVKTLLPSNPTLGTRGWPPNTNGSWRLQVSPTTRQTNNQFLHVLYPTSTSTTSMPDTVRVNASTNNMIGAYIRSSSTNWVVMFSSDSTGSNVTGTITYTISPTTATTKHLIFNLPPSTNYNVTTSTSSGNLIITVTQASGGSYQSSSQGTLNFSISKSGDVSSLSEATKPTTKGIDNKQR